MKKFKTKHALLMSLTSLMLCVSMLIGSTFAWFTDSVTSGVNRIVSGNLDVTLKHQNRTVTSATDVDNNTKLFTDIDLWEPGAYVYETFTVGNAGNLALKYQMKLNALNPTGGVDLRDVIKVATTNTAPNERADVTGLSYTTLNSWSWSGEGNILPQGESDTITVVLYWAPNADSVDNQYNVKDKAVGIDVGVTLTATQYTNESDSFDNTYDAAATQPTITTASATETVAEDGSATLTAAVAPAESSTTSVEFPANALTGESVSMTVSTTDASSASATFAISNGSAAIGSISFDFGDAVTSFNDNSESTATVTTYIATGLTKENITVINTSYNNAKANVVSYDDQTGKLVFTTDHFSDFVIYDSTAVAAVGNKVYTTLQAAVSAAGSGDTVTLLKDVQPKERIYVGEGVTLNGGGHTIDGTGTNVSNQYNCFLVNLANGSTLENATVIKAGYSVGADPTNGKICIKNVVVDYVTYAVHGNGSSKETSEVYVSDSTIYGWNSYSNLKSLTFENCKMGTGNSYLGYNATWSNTNFINCTFEDFYMCGRTAAAGNDVTLTGCTYLTDDGSVKVTADNFSTLFLAEDDETDFGYLVNLNNVTVDGVKVAEFSQE